MNFSRGTMRSSPYVGIFSEVSDSAALIPHAILPKEQKAVENTFECKIIKTSIGSTSLIGILSKLFGEKLLVSEIVTKEEVKHLEKNGLEVMAMDGFSSIGNLIALNKNGGIASTLLSKEEVKAIEGFFKVKFIQMKIAGSDLPGAAITVTNKGFIAHPNISEENFSRLEKIFGVNGEATTANYGDLFVANSVIANSKGVIAGQLTSGIELSKIDQGLRGE